MDFLIKVLEYMNEEEFKDNYKMAKEMYSMISLIGSLKVIIEIWISQI